MTNCESDPELAFQLFQEGSAPKLPRGSPLALACAAGHHHRRRACDGVVPGLVAPGEFQFNVVVPSSLANGDQAVTATYNGLKTQAGTLIAVHQ